jgi:enoyl-CoA hydratase/carnithine racemase
MLELNAALDRLASDHEVRAVVLSGAGGRLPSGADLTDCSPAEPVPLYSCDAWARLSFSSAGSPNPPWLPWPASRSGWG